ncbi:MAG: M20/M25/M40 family metallo-hydrolase [Bryobacteraceae bacterium]|nr:M20/M25/M40 family metallo-hydrolase [Bryobacteraceae bacterium]
MAESKAVRDCLQWLVGQRRWIDQKHLELCRIPAPTFQEQERAEWMAAEFEALGWNASIDKAGNVIAQFPGSRDQSAIALTAHLDTVLAPRSAEDIAVSADGRFHGPGVADNGAGLAALLAMAGAFNDEAMMNAGLPLLLIATVGEEGEGNLSGMRYLCRPSGLGSKIGAFLVLDGPSTERITCRAVASRRFEITFSGPGGHSWSDFGAGNPVHALSRVIAMFSDIRLNGNLTDGDRYSFNFGLIEGGSSVNAIPTLARAKLDLRSESPRRIDELASLLTSAMERALEEENARSSGARLVARVREIGYRPGGRLAEDASLLKCLRAVDAHLGIRSQLECASTDANVPLSLGWQAASIGAGGEGGGAHTPSEWYHPKGREIGLKRIALALALLMRSVAAPALA